MYKIPANTLLIGKNVVFVPECHSTNDYALSLTQSNIPEGTVVITNNQTAGRGQRGNVWEAEPGMNLTFSIILKPKKLAITDQFYLNICVSLAIHGYVKEKTGSLVQIKWPNDVLVNGLKICGILIENQIQGNRFSNTVIGIGLNINQQRFSNPNATSLGIVTDNTFELDKELSMVLEELEVWYLKLENMKFQVLLDHYLNAMYWRNESHLFSSRGIDFEGTITGIDKSGKLEVSTVGGIRYFDVKEVIHKR